MDTADHHAPRPRPAYRPRSQGQAQFWHPTGYALTVGPGDVGIVRFEQLVAKGQRLTADGEMTAAPAALGEALGLRRGYRGISPTPNTRWPTSTLGARECRVGKGE